MGIRVGKPEISGHTRPDGEALSWEAADAGPGPRGSFFPFLIRDFTPRENRLIKISLVDVMGGRPFFRRGAGGSA
jgi:hypothetical protein